MESVLAKFLSFVTLIPKNKMVSLGISSVLFVVFLIIRSINFN